MYGCADAAWPGACCPAGTACRRVSAQLHQCLPDAGRSAPISKSQQDATTSGKSGSGAIKQQQAPSAPSSSDAPAGDKAGGGGSMPDGGSSSSSSSAAKETVGSSSSSGGAANKDSSGSGSSSTHVGTSQGSDSISSRGGRGSSGVGPPRRQPGETLYTWLQVAMDYDELAASPAKMAHFKSDVVAWLRATAAPPAYVFAAGGCGSTELLWLELCMHEHARACVKCTALLGIDGFTCAHCCQLQVWTRCCEAPWSLWHTCS